MLQNLPPDITITASEVHEYFYCPYAWWFADTGREPEQLDELRRGTEYHENLAAQGEAGGHGRNWVFLASAAVLVLAAIVLHLLGLW